MLMPHGPANSAAFDLSYQDLGTGSRRLFRWTGVVPARRSVPSPQPPWPEPAWPPPAVISMNSATSI
jgi:hypothetical protein